MAPAKVVGDLVDLRHRQRPRPEHRQRLGADAVMCARDRAHEKQVVRQRRDVRRVDRDPCLIVRAAADQAVKHGTKVL